MMKLKPLRRQHVQVLELMSHGLTRDQISGLIVGPGPVNVEVEP